MGIIKKITWFALCSLTLCLLDGCATQDHINMSFDLKSGQPIASGLPHPETWVYLGMQRTSDNKLQALAWVKPVGMIPRSIQSGAMSSADSVQAAALFLKPREEYPHEWSESFEYQDLPRPAMSPQAYLEVFKELQLRGCPSGSVTPISVSSTELLLEAKSGGCQRFGDQDEIDRFVFGKTDTFHMTYMVKTLEMTPEQREVAIKAVAMWNTQ
ncbi:MAG TPA: hypothetical protein VMA35_07225 [Candidatus Sulfopaludibacter sp.]|nr:hypothetical protein [Candidatus Sulfopaludibacter sp.]